MKIYRSNCYANLGQPLVLLMLCFQLMAQENTPMRIGIAGLSHDHVHGILRQFDRSDFTIVGISESDTTLVRRLQNRYNFNSELVYPSVSEMVSHSNPEAVLGFGSTYDHLEIVRICAPRGIHVMVEKPLAVNMQHAEEMQQLVTEYGIELLVNYETTWYTSNHHIKNMVQSEVLGGLRKIVVHDGHEGPREIGCSEEFLTWLTNPELNGGGALTDFGCYGANLITWLMNGERPISVSAVTQTIKPDVYPNVDDEATIVLKYPRAQGIIQASWNWPFSRKDMEVYGQEGFIYADNPTDIRSRIAPTDSIARESLPRLMTPFQEPFGYFIAVVRNTIEMEEYAPSSLENNLIVSEILDAARTSAATGEVVLLKN